jgi:hypothetical protein
MQSGGCVKLALKAIECDYRSIFAILFTWLRMDEFGGVYERIYETGRLRFCIIFRAQSLRFAELVQAGVNLC